MSANLSLSLDEIMAKERPAGGAGGAGGGPGKVRPAGRATRRPVPYAPHSARAPVNSVRSGEKGKTVYVGNLSWDVSWQDLKDHFKSVGQVQHADVMLEPGTTRSKGCGLVTFANARDAATAISTLHDTELNGRLIFVREDREGGTGPGTTSRGFGGGAAPPSDGEEAFAREPTPSAAALLPFATMQVRTPTPSAPSAACAKAAKYLSATCLGRRRGCNSRTCSARRVT